MLSAGLPYLQLLLFDAVDGHELRLKDCLLLAEKHLQYAASVRLTQNALGGNGSNASVAIGPFRLDGEFPLLARAHVEQALVPALDDLAPAEGEAQGLATAIGSIELAAVGESAAVMDVDLVAGLGLASALGGGKDFGLEVL